MRKRLRWLLLGILAVALGLAAYAVVAVGSGRTGIEWEMEWIPHITSFVSDRPDLSTDDPRAEHREYIGDQVKHYLGQSRLDASQVEDLSFAVVNEGMVLCFRVAPGDLAKVTVGFEPAGESASKLLEELRKTGAATVRVGWRRRSIGGKYLLAFPFDRLPWWPIADPAASRMEAFVGTRRWPRSYASASGVRDVPVGSPYLQFVDRQTGLTYIVGP